MTRPVGFYWVRGGSEWEPAQWNGKKWYAISGLRGFDDDDFDEIGFEIRGPMSAALTETVTPQNGEGIKR